MEILTNRDKVQGDNKFLSFQEYVNANQCVKFESGEEYDKYKQLLIFKLNKFLDNLKANITERENFKISFNGEQIMNVHNKREIFEVLSMEQLDFFLGHKIWDFMELHPTTEQKLFFEMKIEEQT